MPESLATELLNDIRDQAFDECMELSEALIASQLGTDGSAFGDGPLDRGQRIARVIDMAERGVMDKLQAISPQTYEMLVRQYLHDVEQSPLMGGA